MKSVSNEDTAKNTKVDNPISTNDNGEYVDITEAFTYLNEFRAEEGVWYWNKDNTTKTIFNTNSNNQLKPLSWSYDLEKTALLRAKEIAEKFSHTRPDGTLCFTAYPNDLGAKGENIAYGYSTCKSVTEAWKETNDPYSGQGHRRNMLSTSFNYVGIAGYKVNGIIYWVQCFGYKKNIENEKPSYPTPATKLNAPTDTNQNTNIGPDTNTNELSNTASTKKITKITASKKTFKSKVKTKKYTITLKTGTKAVPKVTVHLTLKGKKYKKTYKATTNNKGKATFKITNLKKKGKYKATITYKGIKKVVQIIIK